MIRAVIVEDEPLARQTLRGYMESVDWIELVGEAEDGRAAVRLINKMEPDIAFLDVQMPELTGIEIGRRFENGDEAVMQIRAGLGLAVDGLKV